MNKILKVGLVFALLLLIFGTVGFGVTGVRAQTGNVEISLNPASGSIYFNQDTEIDIKLKPQGRNITAVELVLNYNNDSLLISSVAAGSEHFTVNESGYSIEGGKHYAFIRSGEGTLPNEIIIGKVFFRPATTTPTSNVFVNIVGVGGSSIPAPLVTVRGQVNALPADQITITNGSYNIGTAPTPTASPTPTGTPTPSPTPTPLPEKPSIIFPESVGRNFVIGADANSNRPEFRWNMMSNPAGSIKRMGVRVVKASDNPNDSSGDFATGCSDKVVVDRWWYSQAATDGQTHNRNQPDSATNLKICADGGEGYVVSPQSSAPDLLAQAFNFNNVTAHAYRTDAPLSPGKYFMTVFNFDNTYHSDANTLGSGTQTSASSNFRSSYYFTVSCPVNSPVWDNSSSRCIAARPTQYALSEDLNELSEGSVGSRWTAYSDTPTVVSYTFQNATPGQVRTIFVRFKDEQNNVNPPFNRPPISKSIRYLGANPEIQNLTCGFNSETGTGSRVTITGNNFGSAQGRGGVRVVGSSGAANATIGSWGRVVIQPTREPVLQGGITGTVTPTVSLSGTPTVSPTITLLPTLTTTPTVTPTGVLGENTVEGSPTPSVTGTLAITPTGVATAQTRDRVVVRVRERLEGTVNVELTVDDGRKITASCAVDTNTVSFATKMQCRPEGSFAADNVRVQIYENIPNARPLYDSRTSPITIGADGTPQWTPPPLEIGKSYNLIIKSPKSLAVKRQFTVLEGTNVLEDITFPTGDIAPANTPDGVVNAVDKSELIRQWSATTDVARSGDFNMDGRINSLDYSCMRENINRAAEQFIRN